MLYSGRPFLPWDLEYAMTGILWAAVASIGWGTADFFAKLSSERIGASSTLFWMQGVSALTLGLLIVLTGTWPAAPAWAWGGALALGLSNVVAVFFLYRAFEVGTLSLVSPIASSFPAVSLVLALVFLDAPWTPVKAAGIATILAGTLLAALVPGDASAEARSHPVANGVPEALVASLVTGGTMFGLVYVAEPLGSLTATWMLRAVATGLLLIGLGVRRAIVMPPTGRLWAVVLAVAAFDTLAFVAYNQSLLGGEVGLAAPISGTFALVTLVLARVVLKERLKPHQWLGVVAVLSGIALVSLPQA